MSIESEANLITAAETFKKAKEELEFQILGTRPVTFDTHGITEECPWFGHTDSLSCEGCVYHKGSKEFTVRCSYE